MKKIEVIVVDSEKVKSHYINDLLIEFDVFHDAVDIQEAIQMGKIKVNRVQSKFYDVFRFQKVKPGIEIIAGNKRIIVE